MKILNDRQIKQKIKRLAIEIYERNYKETSVVLAGINNKGMEMAKMIQKQLHENTKIVADIIQIKLNPAAPIRDKITMDPLDIKIQNKVVIITDDVANTGRTIFFAFKPLLEKLPKKVEVAVMVERTHKRFPVSVDYVGLSLATTLQDNINVEIANKDDMAVFLED